jgi:hypothetical protein
VGAQAIVFLTHVESVRVFLHFERLQEETKGLLSPILCIHSPVRSTGKRIVERIRGTGNIPAPYLRVDAKSGARLLPNRFAQMQRLGRCYNTGFPDLAYMPALLSERMRGYEYIWLVENDVDYGGNWRDFFRGTMGSHADLLSTYIYSRTQDSDWDHWSWFQTPPEVSFNHHTSCFNPIVRFSRRMLSIYVKSVQNDLWQGHTEALWPTIARHNGLTICDLGGIGPFCPEPWRDKHYHNPYNREPGYGDLPHLPKPPFWLSDGSEGRSGTRTGSSRTAGCTLADKVTFIDAPNVQNAYFEEDPTRFLERNVLYHPVKVGWTETQQTPQRHSAFPALRRLLRPLKARLRYWSKLFSPTVW